VALTFPGESDEYRAARDRLLEQEIELRRAMEAVAAARRELPPWVEEPSGLEGITRAGNHASPYGRTNEALRDGTEKPERLAQTLTMRDHLDIVPPSYRSRARG
jgi:hypothetical protein